MQLQWIYLLRVCRCVYKFGFSQQHKSLIAQMRVSLEEAAFAMYIFAQGAR